MQRAVNKILDEYPLIILEDGEMAIDYLRGREPYSNRQDFPMPCLVLLDLKLPCKNGIEVLRWIRSEPALILIPVIMLTSSRETKDVQLAYRAGANSFVVKPNSIQVQEDFVRSLQQYWFVFDEAARSTGLSRPIAFVEEQPMAG